MNNLLVHLGVFFSEPFSVRAIMTVILEDNYTQYFLLLHGCLFVASMEDPFVSPSYIQPWPIQKLQILTTHLRVLLVEITRIKPDPQPLYAFQFLPPNLNSRSASTFFPATKPTKAGGRLGANTFFSCSFSQIIDNLKSEELHCGFMKCCGMSLDFGGEGHLPNGTHLQSKLSTKEMSGLHFPEQEHQAF